MSVQQFKMEYAVNLSKKGIEDIYKTNALTAMLAVKRIWKAFSVSLIRNSWKHTDIIWDIAALQSEILEINKNS